MITDNTDNIDFDFDDFDFENPTEPASQGEARSEEPSGNIIEQFTQGIDKLDAHTAAIVALEGQLSEISKKISAAKNKIQAKGVFLNTSYNELTAREEYLETVRANLAAMNETAKSITDTIETEKTSIATLVSSNINPHTEAINNAVKQIPEQVRQCVDGIPIALKEGDLEQVQKVSDKVHKMAEAAKTYDKGRRMWLYIPAIIIFIWLAGVSFWAFSLSKDKEKLAANASLYFEGKGYTIIPKDYFHKVQNEADILSHFLNRKDTKGTTSAYYKFRQTAKFDSETFSEQELADFKK